MTLETPAAASQRDSSLPGGTGAATSASNAGAGAAIRAEALVKTYGDRRVVDGATFELRRGEILGLLGPNGAGKTTTMRMLTGYTPPTSGRAWIDGRDVARDSLRARAALGYLPENAPLYPALTVREYLEFMCELKRRPRAERSFEVNRVIEACDLGEVSRRRIEQISRGFRQRVGLAQALLGDPAALILDEPTVGLDPRQIVEIRRLIRRAAEGRAVIISTHILPEVSAVCDRALIMSGGRCVASGTPARMTLTGAEAPAGDPALSVRVVIQGDAKSARELIEKLTGVERVRPEEPRRADETGAGAGSVSAFAILARSGADPRAAIARAVIEAGFGLLEIAAMGDSLEDIFIQAISAAGASADLGAAKGSES